MSECKYCGDEFNMMIYYRKDHADICDSCYRKKNYITRLRTELKNKRSKSKFYIYLHYNKSGKCLYVGRTTNIKQRQSAHITQASHWLKVDKIYYGETKNFAEMYIYEIYYINKYKPRYNEAYKTNDDVSFMDSVPQLNFKEYGVKVSEQSRRTGTCLTLSLCEDNNEA